MTVPDADRYDGAPAAALLRRYDAAVDLLDRAVSVVVIVAMAVPYSDPVGSCHEPSGCCRLISRSRIDVYQCSHRGPPVCHIA